MMVYTKCWRIKPHSIDIVFPLTHASVDNGTDNTEGRELIKGNRLFSELFVEIYGISWSGRGSCNEFCH